MTCRVRDIRSGLDLFPSPMLSMPIYLETGESVVTIHISFYTNSAWLYIVAWNKSDYVEFAIAKVCSQVGRPPAQLLSFLYHSIGVFGALSPSCFVLR
jgi:hypothetical protein